MKILDHGAIDEQRRREAARSIDTRLELVRDICDELLDGDSNVDVDEIEGVIFGLANDELAEAQATQRPGGTPPAPVLRILGELIDGMAQTAGRSRKEIAGYTLRMMDQSQASDQYEQSESHSRHDHE